MSLSASRRRPAEKPQEGLESCQISISIPGNPVLGIVCFFSSVPRRLYGCLLGAAATDTHTHTHSSLVSICCDVEGGQPEPYAPNEPLIRGLESIICLPKRGPARMGSRLAPVGGTGHPPREANPIQII